MQSHEPSLPLLPLVLADVPPGVLRALAIEGVPCVERAEDPRGGRFVLCRRRAHAGPSPAAGQTVVELDDDAGGRQLDELAAAMMDESAGPRAWTLGPLDVRETIARRDKRNARRRLVEIVRRGVERAGGVWLRLAAVPWPYRTAFNFRFDHDDFVQRDFDIVLSAIDGWQDATTHYVCASTHAPQADALARLRGLDVGSHGYWHHTYRDADENRRNIARGIDALRGAGLDPVGFAAPHGRWTPDLAGVLRELDIPHSSEFSLAWDEWPFVLDDGPTQVPIHPVCLGIALEAAAAAGDATMNGAMRIGPGAVARLIAEHFVKLIAARHEAREPILLYGHPDSRLGRHPLVLRAVGRAIAGLPGLWRTTHRELAAWRRARSGVRLTVRRYGSSLSVEVNNHAPQWPLALEVCRGDLVAVAPLEAPRTTFELQRLSFEPRPATAAGASRPIGRRMGLRQRLKHGLDWEKATPVAEISATTLRGWTKRTLRKWIETTTSERNTVASDSHAPSTPRMEALSTCDRE